MSACPTHLNGHSA